jgi:hypothetical protein
MRAPLFTNVDKYNQSIEKRKKNKNKNRKENKSNNNQINNLQKHNNSPKLEGARKDFWDRPDDDGKIRKRPTSVG